MSKELDYITELERKNRLLGERCNQLLKDKGDLTDQIADIKANCDLAIEGRDIKIMELEQENNKLLDVINNQDVKIADLEKMLSEQYPDLKQSLGWANKRENENVERLKQAKEIIRTFLNMPMPNNEEVFADVGMFLTKAEQFLKEIKE